MGFVESVNCLDRVLDKGLVGDGASDYFENLELPTDGLEFQCLEDDVFVGDWDDSQWERLGPIPSDNFMQIDETLKEKQLSHFHKIAEVQESSCVFQPTSPVSELESTGSCCGTKSLLIKFNITIPVRNRSKRARPSGVNRWSLIAPLLSTTATSRKTSNPIKYNKRNKNVSQPSVAPEPLDKSFDDGKNPVTKKQCTHCAINQTPQWREGPNGPKTLCNACGVRYRSGRLFPEYRPAASPTFVPSIHSNSHKKVVEMHNKAKQHLTTRIEKHQMSPQPEFLPVSSGYMFDF